MNPNEVESVLAEVLAGVAPEADLATVARGAVLRDELDLDSMDQTRREVGMPTILVAWDFGAPSRRALEWAVRYARLVGGRVVMEHVATTAAAPEAPFLGTDDRIADLERAMRDEGRGACAGGAPVPIEAFVRLAQNPGPAVVDAAKRYGSDLVCVGTRQRPGLVRAVAGSVATEVAHHCPCPVVIVPVG